MIVPVLPTRGLIFAETILSLLRNGLDLNKLVVVSGLPIPDSHNEAVRKALDLSPVPSHILFVEDDMSLPEGVVDQMVRLDKAIVAVNYPVDGGWPTIQKKDGLIVQCGFGCTLINTSVFRAIADPWFVTDKSISADDGAILNIPYKYGGHDIWFCRKALEAGFEITPFEADVKHLRCNQLNRIEYNSGAYEILPIIRKEDIWQS